MNCRTATATKDPGTYKGRPYPSHPAMGIMALKAIGMAAIFSGYGAGIRKGDVRHYGEGGFPRRHGKDKKIRVMDITR